MQQSDIIKTSTDHFLHFGLQNTTSNKNAFPENSQFHKIFYHNGVQNRNQAWYAPHISTNCWRLGIHSYHGYYEHLFITIPESDFGGMAYQSHIKGILPKGPYLPCISMAGRALLAGYPRYLICN